ncbi:MAG: hypothetical protein A4E32_01597 [Methanomassiliicoccales archaeon PtaU1.Bin124]|nr:MAG: hypothetical protein A4E32_01597 [Methanomassiliicoccales archaeon PtaU1.Bin124]
MSRVISFNLPADDMDRAVFFYREVFGWDIDSVPGSGGDYHHTRSVPTGEDGGLLEKGAINGGLFSRGTHGIKHAFIEMVVDSIDECVSLASTRGGKVVMDKRWSEATGSPSSRTARATTLAWQDVSG